MSDENDVSTELSVGFEVGTPVWAPVVAKVSGSLKRVRAQRGGEYMAAVADVAGLTPDELADRCDDERSQILVAGGERAVMVADPEYRDALARIVGAAFHDDAKIDELALLQAEVIKLEPVHLRALGRARISMSVYTVASALDLETGPAEAIVDRLEAAGFITKEIDHFLESKVLRRPIGSREKELNLKPLFPKDKGQHRWRLTGWGHEARSICLPATNDGEGDADE